MLFEGVGYKSRAVCHGISRNQFWNYPFPRNIRQLCRSARLERLTTYILHSELLAELASDWSPAEKRQSSAEFGTEYAAKIIIHSSNWWAAHLQSMDYSHSYSALCSILSDCWTELYMILGCIRPAKKKMTPPARIFCTLCGQLAFILGGHFHDLEDGSKGKVWHYVPPALNGHRL